MKQQYWEALQPGDLVDVIVPAGKPKPHTLKGVQSFLQTWGLKGRIAKSAVGKDLLCGNSRGKRWQHLKAALKAKDSKMIWCVRGGYGCLHLLDELSKLKPQNPKCFLGYSDITTLHTFFQQEWGWATLHGPNIDRFALGTGSTSEAKRIKNIVFGKNLDVAFTLRPVNTAARKKQTIHSIVTGGNLITLQASFGTSFSLDPKGKILFLEEIGERAYRIDRVLEHMRQLQMLKNIRAVILGQFTEGHEPNGRNILPTYFKNWAQEQKFPVLTGVPSGHGPNQRPLPLGTNASLLLGPRAKLLVETGAFQP